MNAGIVFGGAGSWACALQNNNIKTTWYYELWKPAVKCFKSNWKDVHVFDDLKDINGDVDIVVGSPHCNGLSLANPGNSINHSANKLMFKYIDTINYVQPKSFIMEESDRLLNCDKFTLLKNKLFYKIIKIEYSFNCYVLNAIDYGSPQKRNRSYIIGFKHAPSLKKFNLPVKIKHPKAIDVLPKKDFKLGIDYRCAPKINEKGPYSMYVNKQLKGSRTIGDTCHTISGYAWRDIWHPNQRFIAIPEIMAIMGFPENYILTGKSINDRCQLIGKGVDIRFTTRLIKSVIEVLK